MEDTLVEVMRRGFWAINPLARSCRRLAQFARYSKAELVKLHLVEKTKIDDTDYARGKYLPNGLPHGSVRLRAEYETIKLRYNVGEIISYVTKYAMEKSPFVTTKVCFIDGILFETNKSTTTAVYSIDGIEYLSLVGYGWMSTQKRDGGPITRAQMPTPNSSIDEIDSAVRKFSAGPIEHVRPCLRFTIVWQFAVDWGMAPGISCYVFNPPTVQ